MRDLTIDEVARAVIAANAADVLAYLVRNAGNAEDGADLFGEISVVVWRRRRRVPREPVEARKWMFVVARNAVNNHRRARRRAAAGTEVLRGEVQRAMILRASEQTDLQVEVGAAIDQLGINAELVRLVHWDGFSLVETAEILGIPASTARSRYAVAKRKLEASLSLITR